MHAEFELNPLVHKAGWTHLAGGLSPSLWWLIGTRETNPAAPGTLGWQRTCPNPAHSMLLSSVPPMVPCISVWRCFLVWLQVQRRTKSRATGALLSPKTCQGEPGSAPALLSPHLSLPGHPWCWALQLQPEPALGVRCQRHKTLTCRDTGVAKDVSGAVWPCSNTAPSSLLSSGSPVVLYPVLYMESQCSGPCLVPHPSSSFTLKHCEVLVH